jgi:hypothetical protein
VHIVTDAAGRRLGVAGAVIDLAGTGPEQEPPMGGLDPDAPQWSGTWETTATRLAIGHTASLADQSAPIVVRPEDITDMPASGLSFAEGRCRSCVAKVTMFHPDADGTILFVLEHQQGCRTLRRLLAAAGVS